MTTAPLCECHGEPMGWHKKLRLKAGGAWRCMVAHRATSTSWRGKNKEAHRAYSRQWAKDNPEKVAAQNKRKDDVRKQFIVDEKAARLNRCERCLNASLPPKILVWHHRDPSTKEFKIGNDPGYSVTLAAMAKEMDKCELLCPNCHALEHYA